MNPEDIYQKNLQMHLQETEQMPIANKMKPQSESVNRLYSPILRQVREYQEISSNPKINDKSTSLNRGYEDLIAWKQKVDTKNVLLQRYKDEEEGKEQTEQYVYTNSFSNKLIGDSRNKQKVEDILLQKGETKKIKINNKDQEIYGALGKPQINDHQSEYTQKNVYTRLYDKALIAQQHQIQEKQKQIEKSEKKKELLEKQLNEKKKDQQNNSLQSKLKSPEKLLSKPKTHYEATEEQKKLLNLLKQNFNTAKSHLLTQKYLIEEGQTVNLSAQKQMTQQMISQSQIFNTNSKCIEFGASIIKTEADEPFFISNFISIDDESKKRIQNQNELQKSESKQNEIQQTPKQEQQIEEISNNPDNRIIFLTPGINKQSILQTIPSQDQINVMNPKIALLYATSEKTKKQNQPDNISQTINSQNKSQIQSSKQNQSNNINKNNQSKNSIPIKSGIQSHKQLKSDKDSKQSLTDRISTQSNQNEEFTEIKASPQFKQYFKPVMWNQESLNQKTEPNEHQKQIYQYNYQNSNQAIRGTSTRFINGSNEQLDQFTLNQLKQTYSPQQQSLQQIGKSLQFIQQNLANNSQQQTLNQIYTFNQLQNANPDQSVDQNRHQIISTLVGVPMGSQSLLYSKALSKQLEESVSYNNNQTNAKHVYVDFNGQNIHDIPQEEKDPYKRKLLQQQMNAKPFKQKEIEEQLLKLQQWKTKKDQKIQLQRQEKQEKDKKKCTFKPDITPLSIKDQTQLMLSTSGEKQMITSQSPQKKFNSYMDARKQQQEYQNTLKNQNTSQNLYQTKATQKYKTSN